MPSPSLDLVLSEIAARGWLVNNLFQLSPDLWQANLRSPTHSTVFARATCPALALSLALDLLESAEPFPEPAPIVAYDEPARPSLASLLAARTRPVLVRRI